MNDDIDGLASGDFDGVAGDGGAGGLEREDAETGLHGEFHFIRAHRQRRAGKGELSLRGNSCVIRVAGFERAKGNGHT